MSRNSYFYKSITLQMTDNIGEYIRVAEEKVPYVGPWMDCKGDSTAQQAEEQQASFDQQLMNIFTQQYATQKSQLDFLSGVLKPQIAAGGQGYTDAQLTAQRTQATDTNSQQYQNAEQALNNQISQASGGSKLTGVAGATVESDAALANAAAQQEANSQNQITTNNANLQQQNYWNSINALNGVAAESNPLGYAGAATSGSGAVANLSSAYTASNQSQLLGALGGIAGGVGSALGGGFSKGGLFGCWVAASFYGWTSMKTWTIRLWMRFFAPKWFSNFYYKHGELISRTRFRWVYLPIFEAVLVTR
jgi:hypothetical protein